jgi:predicted transcriptional regulator
MLCRLSAFGDILLLDSFERGEFFMSQAKEAAIKIINNLPDQATWDDIMYQLYVKKKIELSLKAAEDGEVYSHEDVKKRILNK